MIDALLGRAALGAIIVGFLLDCLLGDPQNPYHPVRLLGFLNETGLRFYHRIKPSSHAAQFVYGGLMTVFIVALTYLSVLALIRLAYLFDFWAGFAVEAILSYFLIASQALYREGMKIHAALCRDDVSNARELLSTIVGRDTACLDKEKVVKATVETIAENLSDGVIAPLFYLFLGGVPLGFAYKAVNTLDSMIGYQNDTFRYLGKFSARLDDVANLIPARLSALFMLAAAGLLRLDIKKAVKIYARDRYNHLSPNSAHPEAVCAGALNIQLGGAAAYNGRLVPKPTIGDEDRPARISDIRHANMLMVVSSVLFLAVGAAAVFILQ